MRMLAAAGPAFIPYSLCSRGRDSFLYNKRGMLANCRSFHLHDAASQVQSKRDFLGSLENAFDFNTANAASSIFLESLVNRVDQEEIARNIIDSFDEIAPGSWRTVYAQDFSTSFGFGGIFGDVPEVEFEFGNDGSISSNIKLKDSASTDVSLRGSFGTAMNNIFIKIGTISTKQIMRRADDDDSNSFISDLQSSLIPPILETFGRTIFSGVVVVNIEFLDDDFMVFDFEFLGRARAATIASSAAIAYYLLSKKQMTAKEKAIPVGDDANLPRGFVTNSFTNRRSQSLYVMHLPRRDGSKPPKAMLFVLHGIAEHCTRAGYIRLYQSLAEVGVDVYALDHHGHGRSDGQPRGYAEKLDHYVDDLVDYVEFVSKENYVDKGQTPPPLMLLGQSMGGLLAVLAALRLGNERVAGLILTAPALGVDMSLELKVQKLFAPVINTLAPKARIVDAVDPWDMSRNKDAVQQYIDDPLTQTGKLVARTAIGMSNGFEVVKNRRGEINVPILALHGTADKCTSPNATEDFFKHVGTPMEKKRFLKLPAMYHELLEEPETDQILECVNVFVTSNGNEFAQVDGEESDGVVRVLFKEP
eukprot:CCRYP_004628-RA/>CCRYP_004628-RA protein AED:0.11 eAED:0.11 QI:158/0.85/0.75/1/0.71/0.62/8/934/587